MRNVNWILIAGVLLCGLVWSAVGVGITRAHSADLPVPQMCWWGNASWCFDKTHPPTIHATLRERRAYKALPPEIMTGHSAERATITEHFGTLSPKYYARRWAKLCKGGGRYQAMSEAYDQGRPNPCN